MCKSSFNTALTSSSSRLHRRAQLDQARRVGRGFQRGRVQPPLRVLGLSNHDHRTGRVRGDRDRDPAGGRHFPGRGQAARAEHDHRGVPVVFAQHGHGPSIGQDRPRVQPRVAARDLRPRSRRRPRGNVHPTSGDTDSTRDCRHRSATDVHRHAPRAVTGAAASEPLRAVRARNRPARAEPNVGDGADKRTVRLPRRSMAGGGGPRRPPPHTTPGSLRAQTLVMVDVYPPPPG